MNDPFLPFTQPTPRRPAWYQLLRRMRRGYYRQQRDGAPGPSQREWNSKLNWREFWHGRVQLESYPRVVQVGTNWTCNLKCNFCRLTMPWTQAELKAKPGGALQLSARVEAVVERLLPYAEMLTLTPLGEPLMWSGLKDLLARHKDFGSRNLAMTTNGMLMTDARAEMLVRAEVAQLFFSIDSNDPEVYANMRVGGDLRTVEDGVRRVVAWKQKLNVPWPVLTVNATFMRRNIEQLPSMVEWARGLGFEQLSVQLMEIENPEQEGEFLGYFPELTREMVMGALVRGRELDFPVRPHLAIRNLVSAAAEGRNVSEHEYQAASPLLPGERKVHGGGNGSYGNVVETSRPTEDGAAHDCANCGVDGLDAKLDMRGKALVEKCHYPWYNLLIDTDGDARPCCWADASWGNLNELEFDAIWNGERAMRMRRDFLANVIPPSCQKKHCRVDL